MQMQGTTFDGVSSWTRYLVARLCVHCENDVAPLLLGGACLAGTPDGVLYTGREAVCGALARSFSGRLRMLTRWQCQTVAESRAQAVVFASFLAADAQSELLSAQLTAIWSLYASAPRVSYLHLSGCSETAPQLLLDRQRRFPVREQEGVTELIDTDSVIYAEAVNMDSVLHLCSGHRQQIREPFGALCKRLPAEFCRIHRSFAVNRRHVLQIRRYAVLLTERNTLPIPAKRYPEVLAQLAPYLSV